MTDLFGSGEERDRVGIIQKEGGDEGGPAGNGEHGGLSAGRG